MASRFGIVDEEGIDELKELSENENTKKSTEQWKNVFGKWATERGKEKNLEAYECVNLDKTLSQFYAEVCKESGEDYEPDSLRVMQAALERHLKSKLYPKFIIKDRVPQFKKSPGGESAKAKRRRERKTSEPIQKLNKLRRRNPLEKWSAWQWKSPSTYQHDVVVADTTLWLEGATRASQHES